MTSWKETALAALRWVWEAFVSGAKWIGSKIVALGNTIYDPPPVAYRRLFWIALAIFLAGGATFAFVRSWYYQPVMAFLTGDDGDVELPKLEPLPPVPTPATALPSVEVVCLDMSDTPHCVPVKVKPEPVVVTVLPPPKPKPVKRKKKRVRPVKHEPYWPF
jgi:hypothetical protein